MSLGTLSWSLIEYTVVLNNSIHTAVVVFLLAAPVSEWTRIRDLAIAWPLMPLLMLTGVSAAVWGLWDCSTDHWAASAPWIFNRVRLKINTICLKTVWLPNPHFLLSLYLSLLKGSFVRTTVASTVIGSHLGNIKAQNDLSLIRLAKSTSVFLVFYSNHTKWFLNIGDLILWK